MQKIRSHRAVSVGPTCNTRAVTWVVTMRAQIRIQTRTQIRNQIRAPDPKPNPKPDPDPEETNSAAPRHARGWPRQTAAASGLWSAALGAERAGGARRRGADLGPRRWVSSGRKLTLEVGQSCARVGTSRHPHSGQIVCPCTEYPQDSHRPRARRRAFLAILTSSPRANPREPATAASTSADRQMGRSGIRVSSPGARRQRSSRMVDQVKAGGVVVPNISIGPRNRCRAWPARNLAGQPERWTTRISPYLSLEVRRLPTSSGSGSISVEGRAAPRANSGGTVPSAMVCTTKRSRKSD
jgi:hypothetical protein